MMTSRYYGYSIFFLVTLFLLLVFPLQVTAQEGATLRLLVVSEDDGNPVIGANIMLLDYQKTNEEKREVLHGGATNSDGFYEFRNIPSGKYQLEITYIGHKVHRSVVTLKNGEENIERVTLQKTVEQLDEVVIEGENTNTVKNAGLRRINSKDLGRIPTPGPSGDLASYLQTLPGITSGGDRGGDLYIRGGTPAQNKVLIDNLPIIKPFHISNLFSAFPDETIQNIDMYAGGFGAEYMDATSAIIDVSLRPGNMRTYSSKAAVSPYLTSLQMEGPIKFDEQSFFIMGRKSIIKESAPHLTGREIPMNFHDLTARYTYRSGGFSCNVTGMHTFDSGQINPARDLMLSWSNTAVGARCLGFDERYNYPFEITLGYTNFYNDEQSFSQTTRSANIHQGYIKVNLENEFLGVPLDYGFKGNIHLYSADLSEKFTDLQSFKKGTPSLEIYGSAEWEPTKHLTVQPSVGSQVTFENQPTLEPRLQVSYNPRGSNKQEFNLALGKYHQLAEGINDERDAGTVFTVWRPSDKNAPLPKALQGIIGYKQQLGKYFKGNLESYIKKHSAIPVSKWTPTARLEIQTALANGLAHGFDVRLEYNRQPIYFSLGYGWSKITYEAASDDLGAWVEETVFSYSPAHDQRHKINIMGSYRFAGFTASANWELGSGKPYTRTYGFDLDLGIPYRYPTTDPGIAQTLFSRPYGARLPTYHRLDLSIERSFHLSNKWLLEAKAGIINTYNRSNIFYYDLNTLQRINQTPLLPYISIQTQFN